MIELETNSTGTQTLTFCGVDFNDASSKCAPCKTNRDCTGMELCYADVKACDPILIAAIAEEEAAGNVINTTAPTYKYTGGTGADAIDAAAGDAPLAMAMSIAPTTN